MPFLGWWSIEIGIGLHKGKRMSSAVKDINHLLHDLRSAHLRRMPRADVMLSAGCAGAWYFEWIAKQTRHTGRHIGIEFYSPEPPDLPANVEWIANTVGNMSAVADESCDLVFSGENLEHLWPEEVVGFFLESNRVLSPSGWLVVESCARDLLCRTMKSTLESLNIKKFIS
jgi:hypothetical protein